MLPFITMGAAAGKSPPTYIGKGSSGTTPGMPSGWAAGDLGILILSGDASAPQTGWTNIFSYNHPDDGPEYFECYGRILQGGDSGPATGLSGSTIFAWRGTPQTVGSATASVGRDTDSDGNSTHPYYRPTCPEEQCAVMAFQFNVSSRTGSPAAGYTEVHDSTLGSGGATGNLQVDYQIFSVAGQVPSATHTLSGNAVAVVSAGFAIKPA